MSLFADSASSTIKKSSKRDDNQIEIKTTTLKITKLYLIEVHLLLLAQFATCLQGDLHQNPLVFPQILVPFVCVHFNYPNKYNKLTRNLSKNKYLTFKSIYSISLLLQMHCRRWNLLLKPNWPSQTLKSLDSQSMLWDMRRNLLHLIRTLTVS